MIAPVALSGQTIITPGTLLHGAVECITPPSDTTRASLLLGFTRLDSGGVRKTIVARVASVDNAREEVDEQGRIKGILRSETITGRLDGELSQLGEKYFGLAGVLAAAKNAILQEASAEISYLVGVELTVRLTEAATLPPAGPELPIPAIRRPAKLLRLALSEPCQTLAEYPAKPADITNVLLVGSKRTLQRAFADAGWSPAAKLTATSKLQSAAALAEDRGYREAPVSTQLLDRKPPDLVFQKGNNTLARRHHVRIWRRPISFQGRPVWLAAATHDIGISFSDAERTFIHRIDPRVDLERQKVVDDLHFAGHVAGIQMMERPAVPRRGANATGDPVETDGRIAVILLH